MRLHVPDSLVIALGVIWLIAFVPGSIFIAALPPTIGTPIMLVLVAPLVIGLGVAIVSGQRQRQRRRAGGSLRYRQ